MKKSLLYFYLQKFSEGDTAYLDRLCSQLAERLVFAPMVEQEADGGKTVVKIFTVSTPTRTVVPIFTSEAYYESWATARGHTTLSAMSLLCADFCAALAPEIWVVVDDDGPHRAELSPFAIKQIASTESKGEDPIEETHHQQEPAPVPQLIQQSPAVEPTPIIVPTRPLPSQPSPDPVTETAELPPVAPTPPQKSSTATSTRIVRSPMPIQTEELTEEQPKKRSFLNFLKTGKQK